MRLSKITLFTAISFANAKLGVEKVARRLPKDDKNNKQKHIFQNPFEKVVGAVNSLDSLQSASIGLVHNVAMDMLGEVYSEKLPENDFQLMKDIGDVMASFCPREDALCDAMVYMATLEEFHAGSEGPIPLNLSENLNKDIKESIELADSTFDMLGENDKDAVINMWEIIKDDIESMENVNPNEKDMAVASLSVAIESTKLWHSVFTETDHPLHHIVAEKLNERRRLQNNGQAVNIEFSGVYWSGLSDLIIKSSRADFRGAVNGGTQIIDSVPENPLLIWPHNIFFSTVSVALFHSIPASASLVFGTNNTALFST